MFNKFRAVAMALAITAFCMLLIGLFGLQSWLEKTKEDQFTILKKTAFTTLSTIIGVWIISYIFLSFESDRDASAKLPEWLLNAIIDDRKSLFHKDTFRSLFFATTILISLYLYQKKSIQKPLLLGLIVCSSLLDLWSINKRYLNDDDFVKETILDQIKPTLANNKISQDTSNYRVLDLNNPFNNAITSYHHRSIGGYHGAKMQRYQDIIERHLSQNNQKVLDILNCKYIITNKTEQPIFERRTQLGGAWFTNSILEVNSADEEINALNTFDQKNNAVIDRSKFKISSTSFNNTEASITIDQYKPNHLTYTSNNSGNGFAVFSEIYYAEGWNAYIDGKLTPHIRCNYILRGLEIPSGKHKIDFKFEPNSYFIGNKISLVASILVFGLAFGAIFMEIKGIKKQEEA